MCFFNFFCHFKWFFLFNNESNLQYLKSRVYTYDIMEPTIINESEFINRRRCFYSLRQGFPSGIQMSLLYLNTYIMIRLAKLKPTLRYQHCIRVRELAMHCIGCCRFHFQVGGPLPLYPWEMYLSWFASANTQLHKWTVNKECKLCKSLRMRASAKRLTSNLMLM